MEEKAFLDKIKNEERIFIYGAGMVGGLIYNRICGAGLGEKIEGFIVTKRQDGEYTYLDKPVMDVEEAKEKCIDCLIIIATLPDLHSAIEKVLIENEIFRYLKVDRELFRNLSKSYVDDFESKWEDLRDKIDVIFMASDNNRSSGAFLSMADLNYALNQRGISTLIVLPEYGNGESILLSRELQYTYVLSEHWTIKKEEEYEADKQKRINDNSNAVSRLRELIRRYHVQLVHNNTSYTYVGALAAAEENIPCVWHLRERLEDQGNKFIDKNKAIKCINSTDKIITISNYMTSIIDGLDDTKVEVIYNGIDVDKMYIADRPILCKKEIVITIVGVLLPYKGQHELIKAAGILLEKGYSDFKIRLVGDDVQEYTQILYGLTEQMKLQKHVEFVGHQTDMKSVYSQTDIVVICCGIEAFGRVSVEAQLSGCLVIGVNAGATGELIRDEKTGFLYRAGEPENLAECIARAVNNPEEAREIAKNGQKYACEKFTKEKNAEEVICVYRGLLGEDFAKCSGS